MIGSHLWYWVKMSKYNKHKMPIRRYPIVTGEVYHVYNRSVARQPIFDKNYGPARFIELIDFYRFVENTMRYSYFAKLSRKLQSKYLNHLYVSKEQVKILAFCLMPNHFHLLLRQTVDGGINRFISNVQNGYAKYINTKTKRDGSLFQSPFKSVLIESQEQLLHVSRYIHLNPLTSYVLKDASELESYPWASYVDFVSKNSRIFVDEEILLGYFKNRRSLKRFTMDRLDYQRNLELVKHLVFE